MQRIIPKDNLFSSGTMKTGISNQLIDEILTHLNIVDVLENEYGLVLEEVGKGWFKTSCPLPGHRDSDPSFGVHPESGKFNCLGCNRRGNLINFIRIVDGTSFGETLERLRIMAGIDATDDDLELVRLMREINDMTFEFLNRQAETKLPGGMSMIQFQRSIAERLRDFEKRVQSDPNEIHWADSVYMTLDDLSSLEDEVALTKLWNQIGGQINQRITAWNLAHEE